MTRLFIDSDSLQKKFYLLLKEIFSICDLTKEQFCPAIEKIYSKMKKYKDWKKYENWKEYELFTNSNSINIFLINRSFTILKIVSLIFFSLLVIPY